MLGVLIGVIFRNSGVQSSYVREIDGKIQSDPERQFAKEIMKIRDELFEIYNRKIENSNKSVHTTP
jgi:hypothetical protein